MPHDCGVMVGRMSGTKEAMRARVVMVGKEGVLAAYGRRKRFR